MKNTGESVTTTIVPASVFLRWGLQLPSSTGKGTLACRRLSRAGAFFRAARNAADPPVFKASGNSLSIAVGHETNRAAVSSAAAELPAAPLTCAVTLKNCGLLLASAGRTAQRSEWPRRGSGKRRTSCERSLGGFSELLPRAPASGYAISACLTEKTESTGQSSTRRHEGTKAISAAFARLRASTPRPLRTRRDTWDG